MKPLNSIALLLLTVFGATGCGSSGDNHLSSKSSQVDDKKVDDKKVTPGKTDIRISGTVEKGPFVIGSTVTINKLSEKGENTSTTLVTKTINDLGRFEFTATAGDILQITSTGYYRNEITGTLSKDVLTLRSLYEANDNGQQHANVNLLTHLTSTRALALIKNEGQTFEQAIANAEKEFRETFSSVIAAPQGADFASVSIFNSIDETDSAYLLTVSSLIYKYALTASAANNTASEAELTLLVNKLEEDFGADGNIDDTEALSALANMHAQIDPVTVTEHLKQWVADSDSAKIPDINTYLDSDQDGTANSLDTDDDNDGIPDAEDNQPYTAQLVSDDLSLTTKEDSPLEITVSSNSPLQSPIQLTIQSQPQHGTLSGSYPNLSYQPNANFNGQDSFTFVLQQGDLLSREITANIVVSAVNDGPSIAGTPPTTVTAGQAYLFTPEVSDVDLDTLTFSVENLPNWAEFNENTGQISGTPVNTDAADYNGIKLSVTDGSISASLPVFGILVAYSPLAAPETLTTDVEQVSLKRYRVNLSWENVDFSDGYEFQFATEPTFSRPLMEKLTVGNELTFEHEVGKYVWRVRTVNPDGLAGEWSEVHLAQLGVFHVAFGGGKSNMGHKVIATQDNGYVVLGDATSPDVPPTTDIYGDDWIFKVDAHGDRIWNKIISAKGSAKLNDIIALSDGSFIAVGKQYIIKLDSSGELVWQREHSAKDGFVSDFNNVVEFENTVYVSATRYAQNTDGSKSYDGAYLFEVSTETGDLVSDFQLPVIESVAQNYAFISTLHVSNYGALVVGGTMYESYDFEGDFGMNPAAYFQTFNSHLGEIFSWHNGDDLPFEKLQSITDLGNGDFFLFGAPLYSSGPAMALVDSAGNTKRSSALPSDYYPTGAKHPVTSKGEYVYALGQVDSLSDEVPDNSVVVSKIDPTSMEVVETYPLNYNAGGSQHGILLNEDGTFTILVDTDAATVGYVSLQKVKLD